MAISRFPSSFEQISLSEDKAFAKLPTLEPSWHTWHVAQICNRYRCNMCHPNLRKNDRKQKLAGFAYVALPTA